MKVLVDTNILLDVALQRAPHFAESDRVVNWCEAHPGHGFIAWHSISNVYYILQKQIGDTDARPFIAMMIDIFDVAETGTAQAKHALALPMADFEDAMQAAAAVQSGVDYIVTRNIADYRNSLVPGISPADFLARAPA